ncbi:MAG: hypothetical protein M0C28_30540 [Candidatus Moduliflexus flocculans]|nr:hypothetical protein [Candidatus Moduliflexus flocculans]
MARLAGHPLFRDQVPCRRPAGAPGLKYREACTWRAPGRALRGARGPDRGGDLPGARLGSTSSSAPWTPRRPRSSRPLYAASKEPLVFSNASAVSGCTPTCSHPGAGGERADHLALLEEQRRRVAAGGRHRLQAPTAPPPSWPPRLASAQGLRHRGRPGHRPPGGQRRRISPGPPPWTSRATWSPSSAGRRKSWRPRPPRSWAPCSGRPGGARALPGVGHLHPGPRPGRAQRVRLRPASPEIQAVRARFVGCLKAYRSPLADLGLPSAPMCPVTVPRRGRPPPAPARTSDAGGRHDRFRGPLPFLRHPAGPGDSWPWEPWPWSGAPREPPCLNAGALGIRGSAGLGERPGRPTPRAMPSLPPGPTGPDTAGPGPVGNTRRYWGRMRRLSARQVPERSHQGSRSEEASPGTPRRRSRQSGIWSACSRW